MYGAALGVAGAGLSAYGAQKQKHAMGDANQWYNNQLQGYYGRQDAQAREDQAAYNQLNDRGMANLGAALQGYMATPYGRTADDTATAQAALQQVGAGNNPGQAAGLTGAASTWGAGIADRNQGFSDRQQLIAGNAAAQQRQSYGHNTALSDYGIAQQRLGAEVQDLAQLQAIRQAEAERELQRLNMAAQDKFTYAQGVGSDQMMIGGLMGAGGGLADLAGGAGRAGGSGETTRETTPPPTGGSRKRTARGSRHSATPNYSPTGRQTGGGYHTYSGLQDGWGYISPRD